MRRTVRKIENEEKQKEGEVDEENKYNAEIESNIKKLKTINRTLKNNGKPVNEELLAKRKAKYTPFILFLYLLVFIFSGLSLIIKVYGILKNR